MLVQYNNRLIPLYSDIGLSDIGLFDIVLSQVSECAHVGMSIQLCTVQYKYLCKCQLNLVERKYLSLEN